MEAAVGIGVSGHQSRPGIDWDWTAERIRHVLIRRGPVSRAFTSLAIGSDQVFAREALALNIPVTAIIPMPDYERCFNAGDRPAYLELLGRCQVFQMQGATSDEEAFFAAGRQVADNCNLLIAVWDGRAAVGLGGTADVVNYCLQSGCSVVHIDPIVRTMQTLLPNQN